MQVLSWLIIGRWRFTSLYDDSGASRWAAVRYKVVGILTACLFFFIRFCLLFVAFTPAIDWFTFLEYQARDATRYLRSVIDLYTCSFRRTQLIHKSITSSPQIRQHIHKLTLNSRCSVGICNHQYAATRKSHELSYKIARDRVNQLKHGQDSDLIRLSRFLILNIFVWRDLYKM